MALPDEDLGPSWLSDYGTIEADIRRLAEFAAKLDAEVRQHYIPHLASIDSDMTAVPPAPAAEFAELCAFLDAHWSAQVNTTNNIYAFRDGTGRLANAAQTVSRQYAGVDAFSAARVRDVEVALDQAGVTRTDGPAPVTDSPVAGSGLGGSGVAGSSAVGPGPGLVDG